MIIWVDAQLPPALAPWIKRERMGQDLITEILALPLAERIRLAEAIWDSVSAAQEALPLGEWHRDQLDRRLAEFEADPESGATLEEVFARIRRSS